MVYSFDVFDTCLIRTYARPTDLFYDLAPMFLTKYCCFGYDDNSINLFVYARKLAERQIRNINKTTSEDITLLDIYKNLSSFAPWSFDINVAMDYEIQLEQKSLKPVLFIREFIEKLRMQQHRIIFISDMYLPTYFIKNCLVENNIASSNDNVYVSGDIGLTKRSGNLFKYVLAVEKITPNELYHFGDNFHADISMAKLHGIKTKYFAETQLYHYERSFLKAKTTNQLLFFSKLAAASRFSRLNQFVSHCPNTLNDLSSAVIAPFLIAFVAWVLKDAKVRGIQRLYFVSRDGQIMYKIAQKLISTSNDMPECRYLYGSRQAWFPPSICQPDWKQMAWLLHGQNKSLSELLKKLCIAETDLEKYLYKYGLELHMFSQVEGEVLIRFKKFILDPDIFSILQIHLAKLRNDAIGYFNQEGLFADKRWTLVDLGWGLNCQSALQRILFSGGRTKPVEGYYLGINKNCLSEAEAGLRYGWIIQDTTNNYLNNRCDWLFRSNSSIIIEHLFTPADHSTVSTYKKINKTYNPVFVERNNDEHNQFTNSVHRSVLNFLNLIPDILEENNFKNFSKIAISNVEHFLTKPLPEYVENVSKLHINSEQSHNNNHNRQLAARMTLSELFNLLAQGKNYVYQKHVWLEGSATLSPLIIKMVLRTVLFFRNMLLIYNRRSTN